MKKPKKDKLKKKDKDKLKALGIPASIAEADKTAEDVLVDVKQWMKDNA